MSLISVVFGMLLGKLVRIIGWPVMRPPEMGKENLVVDVDGPLSKVPKQPIRLSNVLNQSLNP